MNQKPIFLKKNKKSPLYACALAVSGVFFLFSGCFANYGGYRPSREVDRMFESHQVPPEYHYYYAGSDKDPDAIIGLDPAYTLDNDLWKKTDLNMTRLRRWVDEITVLRGFSLSVYGSYILGPAGKVIGIYYSKWDGGPVYMESDHQVIVHLPDVRDQRRSRSFG